MHNYKKILLAAAATLAFGAQAVAADKLKIGTEGAYPPFNLIDASGQVGGFDVEIAQALCAKMGAECEVVTSDWDGIIPALNAKKFDFLAASMSVTEERKQAVDFTDPYYRSGLSIWVQEETDDVSSISDFEGKRVGSTLGETGNQWATEQADGRWRNQTFQGLPDMLNALTTGRIDVMVADDIPVYVALNEDDIAIKQVDVGDLPRFPAAIAVQKGSPQLKEALNEALAEIKADGTYQEIVVKWIGEGVEFN